MKKGDSISFSKAARPPPKSERDLPYVQKKGGTLLGSRVPLFSVYCVRTCLLQRRHGSKRVLGTMVPPYTVHMHYDLT